MPKTPEETHDKACQKGAPASLQSWERETPPPGLLGDGRDNRENQEGQKQKPWAEVPGKLGEHTVDVVGAQVGAVAGHDEAENHCDQREQREAEQDNRVPARCYSPRQQRAEKAFELRRATLPPRHQHRSQHRRQRREEADRPWQLYVDEAATGGGLGDHDRPGHCEGKEVEHCDRTQ